MGPLDVAQGVLGALTLCWLPGYSWVRVFSWRESTPLERFVLSVLVSIASLTLFYYLANVLLDLRVTPANGVLLSLLVASVPPAMSAYGFLSHAASTGSE